MSRSVHTPEDRLGFLDWSRVSPSTILENWVQVRRDHASVSEWMVDVPCLDRQNVIGV